MHDAWLPFKNTKQKIHSPSTCGAACNGPRKARTLAPNSRPGPSTSTLARPSSIRRHGPTAMWVTSCFIDLNGPPWCEAVAASRAVVSLIVVENLDWPVSLVDLQTAGKRLYRKNKFFILPSRVSVLAPIMSVDMNEIWMTVMRNNWRF